ncbi:hypothetical protein [Lacipirellula limnantheis]|nr:hypothetical protein [Lacipirellula limnantheis]
MDIATLAMQFWGRIIFVAFKKYVFPGDQQTQWNAITNHAEGFGLRISVFFTFYAGDGGVASALKSKFTKKSLEEGTFAFIISLKV